LKYVFASLSLFVSMRIMPQDQDTGGFFVAVLEKTGSDDLAEVPQSMPEPVLAEGEAGGAEGASGETVDSGPKQTRWQQRGTVGENEQHTGAEGLVPFSTHPTLAKQWTLLRYLCSRPALLFVLGHSHL
jgi:hypothetical protein